MKERLYLMEVNIVEYLENYCLHTDCKDKNFVDCDTCMYKKGRNDALKEIMPILIHIVYDEGCAYGFDDEINKLEKEWENIKAVSK